MVYSKGADNVMKPLLSQECRKKPIMTKSEEHVKAYSRDGLRILVIAHKSISAKFYEEWSKRWYDASNSTEDREKKQEAVMAEVERDLELCGVTAIEDKLQDGVPETISALRSGGVKVWVLTGDKVDTAINIGYACQVVVHSEDENVGDCMVELNLKDKAAKDRVQKDSDGVITKECIEAEINRVLKEMHDSKKPSNVCVIDTYYLTAIVKHGLGHRFVEVAGKCKSLIAARVSPDQKGAIVMLIRGSEPESVVT